MLASPSAGVRLLTFTLGGERYGVPSDRVSEVIRVPRLARVPHGPDALLGLCNLRGAVLPVVSLARLMRIEDEAAGRIIVFSGDEQIGLAVDRVSEITADGAAVRQVDVAALLARVAPGRLARRTFAAAPAAPDEEREDGQGHIFFGFTVAGQEFALPLAAVDEVRQVPAEVMLMPHADAAVIGSAAVRGAVLPLLSLRVLLGFPPGTIGAGARVLVVRIGASRVGLVVDTLRSILRVPLAAIDPVPPTLSRGAAETRIQAICRLDEGKRLMSVLAPEHILRADITAGLVREDEEERVVTQGEAVGGGEQFLMFRVGSEEFALPVSAVDEVAPLPDKLARLPRSPAFVKGVINLRGEVIPVIDQAQRFGTGETEGAKRRVVVVRIDGLRAGFVVDAVSEVTRLDDAALRATPDLGSEETQVFERIANLPDQGRMVLIVSPRELLTRMERDVLRTIGNKTPQVQP